MKTTPKPYQYLPDTLESTDVIVRPTIVHRSSDTRVSVSFNSNRAADDIAFEFENNSTFTLLTSDIATVSITERKRIMLRRTAGK